MTEGSENQPIQDFAKAKAIVRLLQGVVYNDDPQWKSVVDYQISIAAYFREIGIQLIVDQADGYAYLKQIILDDDGTTIGLVRRTPIPYEISLICVFLREILDDFDTRDSLSTRCLINHKQIKEHIEYFFKEKPNTKKFFKEIDSYIRKVEEYGFLKLFKDSAREDDRVYEIKRIIKAKVSSDTIEEFRKKMEEYA